MPQSHVPFLQHANSTTAIAASDLLNCRTIHERGSSLPGQAFCIRDPIHLPSESSGSSDQLRISSLSLGEVSFTSIQGFSFAVHLEPLQPRCTLVLPADGQAKCRMDNHDLTCRAGGSIGFLPARSWQLINNCGAGLGVHFTEESLLTRLMAMGGGGVPGPALRKLSNPIQIELEDAHLSPAYQQLLMSLWMLEEIIATTLEMPHPYLSLDDLILRAIALILCPEISAHPPEGDDIKDWNHLQLTVRELMGWLLANLDKPISLTDIEQRSNYGRRSIQAGFKREVGCGPMQWLRRQRLEAAYQELQAASPNVTVTAVARRYGYLNLSCFSRDFTEAFKRPPSSVLRQAKALSSRHPASSNDHRPPDCLQPGEVG